MSEYWPRGAVVGIHPQRALFELRGAIATNLVEKWGTVAGSSGKEDSAGRAYVALMPEDELVTRCCDIADKLVAELERRQWVRPDTRTDAELAAEAGEFEAIKEDKRFPWRQETREAKTKA